MKITVLDRDSMGRDLDFQKALSAIPGAEITVFDKTSAGECLLHVGGAEVVILNKVKMTADIIGNAPDLRLICVFATGFDNIDLAAAKSRGVAVCNVPAYSTESVTLLTVSTALALLSKLPTFSKYVKDGVYTKSGIPNYLSPVFHECPGLTWGIVGCGNIGSRVAEVATALGMNVVICQRHDHPPYSRVPLDELCRRSDVISLHCPLTEATRGMIGEKEIGMMKNSVILVNEARGAVVDEAAVSCAVLSGKIGGFGCDVYGTEPFPADHPYGKIKDLPNVVFTPHIAWAAYESRLRCLSVICQNILDFIQGKYTNRVDK